MAIATFAYKVFQVTGDHLYNIDELQYNSSLQTEKQDAEGTKPSTYNKGPDLDSMSFKIKLDIAFGVKPRQEWEEWQALMNAAVAYPFILGGKPLGAYNWLLIGVTPSNFSIDNQGNILSMDLELKFDEYVRAGAKKEKSNKSGKSKGTGNKDKGKEISGLSEQEFDSLIDD